MKIRRLAIPALLLALALTLTACRAPAPARPEDSTAAASQTDHTEQTPASSEAADTLPGEPVTWTADGLPGPDCGGVRMLASSSYEWTPEDVSALMRIASTEDLERELGRCAWNGTLRPVVGETDRKDGADGMTELADWLTAFDGFPFEDRTLCVLRLELPAEPLRPKIVSMRLVDGELRISYAAERESDWLNPSYAGFTMLTEIPAGQAGQIRRVCWDRIREKDETGPAGSPEAADGLAVRIYSLHPAYADEGSLPGRESGGERFCIVRSYEELQAVWQKTIEEYLFTREAPYRQDNYVEIDPSSRIGEYRDVTLAAFLEEYRSFPFEEKSLCLLFGRMATTPTRFRVTSCAIDDGELVMTVQPTAVGGAEALYPYTAFVEMPAQEADSVRACRIRFAD